MEPTEAKLVAKNSRVGATAVSGTRANSVNREFNHRDHTNDRLKRESAAHAVAGVSVVSEGVPRLGNTQEEHDLVVKKMRLRVLWALRSHTHDGKLDEEDKIKAALLFEILGIDKKSQDESVLRLAGPQYTKGWNSNVKTDN